MPLILPFLKVPNQSYQLNCVCVIVVVVGAIPKFFLLLHILVYTFLKIYN